MRQKQKQAIKVQGTKDDILREANQRFIDKQIDYLIPDIVKEKALADIYSEIKRL